MMETAATSGAGAGTSLIEALRAGLGDAGAASFQLMGEDLALLPGAWLRAAAARYEADLASLPPTLRHRFEAEQASLLREAHGWLRRYNHSLYGRVRGYIALGRSAGFEYPWPVVAVLGICQVLSGIVRNRAYGLVGAAAARLPLDGIDALEQLTDGIDDVLRRTNRGIFADSIPTVLLGLRAHALRQAGDEELARALLLGPLPLLFDEQNRRIAHALYEGLAIPDAARRFTRLSALTLEHFGREQAIFTYHMGTSGSRGGAGIVARLVRPRSVPAPVIERGRRGARVVFRDFPLPSGFDMRDHDARVEAFGRAFVRSVTGSRDDYEVARKYAERQTRRAKGS